MIDKIGYVYLHLSGKIKKNNKVIKKELFRKYVKNTILTDMKKEKFNDINFKYTINNGNYIIYGKYKTNNNYIHNKSEEYNFLSYWIDFKYGKIDIYRESNGKFKDIIDKKWKIVH